MLIVIITNLTFHSYKVPSNVKSTADVTPAVSVVPPIFIDDQSPLDSWATHALLFPWISGSGTPSDPYTISDILITSDDSDCITIYNSDANFMIYGCQLISSGESGIILREVSNGAIFLNEILDNGDSGIRVFESSNLLIWGNEIRENTWSGIYTFKCSNLVVSDNIIRDNDLVGITLLICDTVTVTNNRIRFHEVIGIQTGWCSNITITENFLSNHSEGVYSYRSTHNKIARNIVRRNSQFGILLQFNCTDTTISSNTLSENRFCMGVCDSCRRSHFFNNTECQVITFDDWVGSPPFTEEQLRSLLPKELQPNSIWGYPLTFLIGSFLLVLGGMYIQMKRKLTRKNNDFYS